MRTIFIIAVLPILVTSCLFEEFSPEEWAIEPELVISESGLVFTNNDASQKVGVSTNYKEYIVYSSEDWCEVHAEKDSVVISVSPNMSVSQRKATVTVSVTRGNRLLSRDISIVQLGGYWDLINGFSVNWSYEVSESQKDVVKRIIDNMKYVRGGSFLMGGQNIDPEDDNYYEYYFDGYDVHEVTLSDYYIGAYEVTQEEWNAIMGSNGSRFQDQKLPVENISWEEAVDFTSTLSRLTGLEFCLPTEAQWEYAARGGIYDMMHVYPGSDSFDEVAYHQNSNITEDDPKYITSQGGLLKPNELGLYDMAGNVAEMCLDIYGEYGQGPLTDPTGAMSGDYHVVRGGGFLDIFPLFSVYSRWMLHSSDLDDMTSFVGVRLVLRS